MLDPAEWDEATAAAVARRIAPHLRKPAPDPNEVFATGRAAKYMDCSTDRIYDLVRLKHLRCERDGRSLRFRRHELDRWLASGGDR